MGVCAPCLLVRNATGVAFLGTNTVTRFITMLLARLAEADNTMTTLAVVSSASPSLARRTHGGDMTPECAMKHLHNVETRFYCSHTFLSLHCSVEMMFLSENRRFGIAKSLQSLSAVLQIDFQQKEAELFAPQSILPWFAWDTKLGSLTLHLDSTQTFAAEVYAYTMGLQVLTCACPGSFASLSLSSLFPSTLSIEYGYGDVTKVFHDIDSLLSSVGSFVHALM